GRVCRQHPCLRCTELLWHVPPYRAVDALPLQEANAGLGAIDLFFQDEAAVPRLDVFEAMAVGDLVTTELSEAAVWSTWSAARGPAWMHSPSAERRSAVWHALGAVGLALEVEPPTALELLRATARATDSTVD